MFSCFYLGAGSQFRKSEWYLPQQGERKFDLFAERDIIVHRNHRRLVNNAYATSSLMELEPYMDSAIAYFMTTLQRVQGQRIDFGLWLQLFAFGTYQYYARYFPPREIKFPIDCTHKPRERERERESARADA